MRCKITIKKILVIIIIFLLVFIVLISINKLIDSKDMEYYNKYEKEMIKASKEYFSNFKSYLPSNIGDDTRVLLSALVLEGYIDMIKDINGNDCDRSLSYVEVEKISDSKYLYKAHLVCGEDDYETWDGDSYE